MENENKKEIKDLTEGEKHFIYYLRGSSGSFYTKLFKLMESADPQNLFKLGVVYPEEVDAFKKYREVKGYYESIKHLIER